MGETPTARTFRGPETYIDKHGRETTESIEAYVGRNADMLAVEFCDWWRDNGRPGETWREHGLCRFEIMRFGNPLYRCAHGLLGFAVVKAMSLRVAHAADGDARQPRRKQLSPEDRLGALVDGLGKAVPDMPRPTAAQTGLVFDDGSYTHYEESDYE